MEDIVLPSDTNVDNEDKPVSNTDEQDTNTNTNNEQEENTNPVQAEATFDTSIYEQEYIENGELSEESYKALAQKGISKEIVDRYIEGRKAYVQAYDNEVMATCGGEAEYRAMAEWAKSNLTDAEIESFNKAVQSRDVSLARFAVQGLYARYKTNGAEKESTPKFVEGAASSRQASVYKSTSEIVQDKKDKRYETDRAYRKTVDEKIRRSIAAGTI